MILCRTVVRFLSFLLPLAGVMAALSAGRLACAAAIPASPLAAPAVTAFTTTVFDGIQRPVWRFGRRALLSVTDGSRTADPCCAPRWWTAVVRQQSGLPGPGQCRGGTEHLTRPAEDRGLRFAFLPNARGGEDVSEWRAAAPSPPRRSTLRRDRMSSRDPPPCAS